MQLLTEIKLNLLRIFGKTESLEKFENASELNAALESLPSVAEQISTQMKANNESLTATLENLKKDLLSEVSAIKESNVSLAKEIADIKGKIAQPGAVNPIPVIGEVRIDRKAEKPDFVAAAGFKRKTI